MPAILTPDAIERLDKAGRIADRPPKPAPPPPAPTSDSTLQTLTAQVAELSKRVQSLENAPGGRPSGPERWSFKVDQRDAHGRIVSMTAEPLP